jgi:hypothetical protein
VSSAGHNRPPRAPAQQRAAPAVANPARISLTSMSTLNPCALELLSASPDGCTEAMLIVAASPERFFLVVPSAPIRSQAAGLSRPHRI